VKAFRYERPTTVAAVVEAMAGGGALLKASGIDVLDRMKERVDEPARVVTLIDVPGLDGIERAPEGGLRLGAMTTLAALAASADVRALLPTLAEAAGLAASPALRNRATLGGNLAQQTRCGYFRMKSFACFKRGDAICPVLVKGGVQDNAGIFGIQSCGCAHPSSVAPVLGAAGAMALVLGAKGERRVPFGELYAPPVNGKASDLSLAPDEVIVRIDVPPIALGAERVGYAEIRQKQAFDWPLVTCAVWFVGGESAVKDARVWLGSVAPSPWRSEAAEKALVGKAFSASLAATAGEAAVTGATPLDGNAYKVDLVQVAVKRALMAAWERK
jgi:xanthine dehydrogenase YagS FAD-binding subunit